MSATEKYIEGFLDGQALAYCEMVSRGVRLAGQLDVPAEACAQLLPLIEREGCLARVASRDPGRSAIWIYRDKRVERLIAALDITNNRMGSVDIAIWSMGKLFGYGDGEVLDFMGREQP